MTDKEFYRTTEAIQELMQELNTFVNSGKDIAFIKPVLQHITQMVHMVNTSTPFTSKCDVWVATMGRTMGADLRIRQRVTTVLPEETDEQDTECNCNCNKDSGKTCKQTNNENMYRRYTAKKCVKADIKTHKTPIRNKPIGDNHE